MSRPRIPRHKDNDYIKACASVRRDFVKDQTSTELTHMGQYPSDVLKNIMRVDGKTLLQQRQVFNTGSLMTGNANVADRRHLRWRHRTGDTEGTPRRARMLRRR